MKTLFNIFLLIVILLLFSLIVSLIPISKIGDLAIKMAKENNIVLYAKNGWNFRLIGFRGATSKINYSFSLNKTKILGFGENFTYGLTNGNVYFEKLSIEVHFDKGDTIADVYNNLKQFISKKYYTFEVKNLIISFYSKNENDQGKQNDELIFNDVKIAKHKNFKAFMANIAISKNKKNTILFTINNPGTKKYELNAKVEDDDFYCYVYDSFNEGNISCLSRNMSEVVHNIIGRKIENKFLQTFLDKRVSLKANISHIDNDLSNNEFKINGKLMINNDYGDINYNSANNIIDIKFDNVDLNKTTEDVKSMFQDVLEQEQRSQAIAMSGKENRILLNTKKKDNTENTNIFGKVILYLIDLSKDIEFTTKINVNKATVGIIPIENFTADVSKKLNGKFKLNEVSALFGNELNSKFLIKDSDNQIENLSISGKNINDIAGIFGLKALNSSISSDDYSINGYIDLSTNSISMKNISCSLNGIKICIYDMLKTYDYNEKNIFSDEKIIVQNMNINDNFDMIKILKRIHQAFNNFQQQEKQDAIFWKSLFEKRNQDQSNTINKFSFVLNNTYLYDKKINYFIFEYNDSKQSSELNIISDSEIMDGKCYFDSKNINDKEVLTSKINIKDLDLNFNETFFHDIEMATNRKFSEIFYENRDYNIPSLIGLNGFFDVLIDNFGINNNYYKKIAGKINLRDGILSTEEFKFNYNSGKINSNMILSLQGRPEAQIAISGSNLNIKDLINTPISGIISFKCLLKVFGFNPVKFAQIMNGNGKIIVQNIKIPKFDLLHMSSESITNGLRLNYDYKSIVENGALYFPYGEGNILIENGMLNGDLSLSRELVSGSIVFEYNIIENILRQISGSFAVLMAKKRLSTPFPIYIPFACNGKPEQPSCLVNWGQLEDILKNLYQSV